MLRFAALNDKLHKKMVEEGIPDAIAAYVSDDANRVPGETRKFVAKALTDKLKQVETKKKKPIDPAEFVSGMEGVIGEIRDWLTYATEPDGSALNMHAYKTFEDMQEAAHEWHRILTQQMKDKGHPLLYKADDPQHTLQQFKDNWRIVEVPAEDLTNEGNMMGHCVGRGGYTSGVKDGTTRIISLRDKQGIPHVTIEAAKGAGKGWQIRQVQGKGNQPPVDKYRTFLYDFFKDHPEYTFSSWGVKARTLPAGNLAFELAKQFIEDPKSYEVANILERELDPTDHQKFYSILAKYFADKDPEEVAAVLDRADPDIVDGLLQSAKQSGNMGAFMKVLQSGSADDSLFGVDMTGKDYYSLPDDIRYSEMMRRFDDPKSVELLSRYLDSMPRNMIISPEWRSVLDGAMAYFAEHAGENKDLDNKFKQDMFGRIAASYLREDASPEEFADGLQRVMELAIKFPDKKIASHILWIAKRNPDLIRDAIGLIDNEGLLWTLKDYLDAYQLDRKMKERFESHEEVPDEYIREDIRPLDRRLGPEEVWKHERPRAKGPQWAPLLDPLRDTMERQIDRGMYGRPPKQEEFPFEYQSLTEEQEPEDEYEEYVEPAADDDDDDFDYASRSFRERLVRMAIRCERRGDLILSDRLERIAKRC